MYSISYKKPNDRVTFITYQGGNNEEEAKVDCLRSAVAFHNPWNELKLTENDLTIVKFYLAGAYDSVLNDLQRG
jgi:hypothetical protein